MRTPTTMEIEISKLGPPSDHKPKDVVDQQELKGNEREGIEPIKYPNYLPIWEVPMRKHPPLQPFEYVEHGKGADPSFQDLLGPGGKIQNITASIGAEVTGVQLSRLGDRGKDQLALLTAQKGVVVFRDQDFADIPIGNAVNFASYFGRLSLHPHSGAPAGHPEVHIVHRKAGNTVSKDFFASHTHSMTWHSDNTYENQPPGVTFLYALETPAAGGDTTFVNTTGFYQRLSPAFRERLHGLRALHSAYDQTQRARQNGGYVRREPITSIHPIVRTHPATGEKALFINPQFTRYIVGLKQEESEFLLKFLYDQLAMAQDLQCRVKWAAGTVVVWDNRVTNHSAIVDWEDGRRRHIARIMPEAEAPYE